MSLITPDLSGITDGSIAVASAWTNPFNTITTAINGGLDDTNFTAANTNLSTIAKSVAWTSYVPTWTADTVNPAIGNGTLTGAYYKVGRLVTYRFNITMGSTSTFGTDKWYLSLPATAATANTLDTMGTLRIYDSSATTHYIGATILSTSTNTGKVFFVTHLATDYVSTNGSTHPIAWATSDQLVGEIVYEAAS